MSLRILSLLLLHLVSFSAVFAVRSAHPITFFMHLHDPFICRVEGTWQGTLRYAGGGGEGGSAGGGGGADPLYTASFNHDHVFSITGPSDHSNMNGTFVIYNEVWLDLVCKYPPELADTRLYALYAAHDNALTLAYSMFGRPKELVPDGTTGVLNFVREAASSLSGNGDSGSGSGSGSGGGVAEPPLLGNAVVLPPSL